MIDIGGGSTEVLAFKDERLRLARTLPWGAATVSNDIVKGLGVPLAEAEQLKARYGTAQTSRADASEKFQISGPTPGGTREVSRELLAHIIEQRLDEIFGLVFEELESRNLLDHLPGGVVLTGGGAEMDGVVELAQEVFNLPVAKGLPGYGLDGVVEAIRRPECASAVGLALYGRGRCARGLAPCLGRRCYAPVTESFIPDGLFGVCRPLFCRSQTFQSSSRGLLRCCLSSRCASVPRMSRNSKGSPWRLTMTW